MKVAVFATLLLAAVPVARAESEQSNPLGKVLELIDQLEARIIKEGEVEAKSFKEYFEWCDDVSKNTAFEIKTGEAEKEKLTAKIDKLVGDIDEAETAIEKLAAEIAARTTELKKATTVRKQEEADFAASEKELMATVDALERAIGILEKQAKGGASLAQVGTNTDMAHLVTAISAILDAAAFPSADQKRLSSFLQAQQQATADAEADDGLSTDAPQAAAYESHSGGIIEVLEDVKEKAEGQLGDLRKAETQAKHNYEMLKQSLEGEMDADTKDMNEEKETKAASEEAKAAAEGDLEVTTKELAHGKEELAAAQANCMTSASDHQSSMTSRAEELKVIGEAKKILEETTGGAEKQSASFVQTSVMRSNSRVGNLLNKLARRHHSSALAQLSSRVDALVKYGQSSGENPFGKIKGLIEDMIAKLEKEADEEATEKAYCDEEMSKTEAKKGDLEDDVDKMTAKIDQAAAKAAELRAQVKEVEKELAALAKEQAEMDKIRQETHAEYKVVKADLETALGGVRKALGLLRDYYASKDEGSALIQEGDSDMAFMQQPSPPATHSKSGGAGESIIGILEVCESDFATGLAKAETEEADAQSEYEKMTQENDISKTSKQQDVKYKTKEYKSLDTTIAELSEDRTTANTELSAVNEYYAKIKDRCVAKPETYEERKKRREAEIAGLKEALAILEDETAFAQMPRKRRGNMRGAIEAQ